MYKEQIELNPSHNEGFLQLANLVNETKSSSLGLSLGCTPHFQLHVHVSKVVCHSSMGVWILHWESRTFRCRSSCCQCCIFLHLHLALSPIPFSPSPVHQFTSGWKKDWLPASFQPAFHPACLNRAFWRHADLLEPVKNQMMVVNSSAVVYLKAYQLRRVLVHRVAPWKFIGIPGSRKKKIRYSETTKLTQELAIARAGENLCQWHSMANWRVRSETLCGKSEDGQSPSKQDWGKTSQVHLGFIYCLGV